MQNIKIFPDSDKLAEAIALRLKKEADQALKENRIYSIVLSGGSSVEKLYHKLAIPGLGDQIPWKAVHLFWADERCVARESEQCNFNIAHRTFIKSISIPNQNIHRIKGEMNPNKESIRYEMEIREHLNLKHSKDFFLTGY